MGKLFGVDNANSLNMQNRYDIEIDKDTTDLKSWQQAAASIATPVTEPQTPGRHLRRSRLTLLPGDVGMRQFVDLSCFPR